MLLLTLLSSVEEEVEYEEEVQGEEE